MREAQERVSAEVVLPPGWWIEWDGRYESLVAATQWLSLLVPTALLLIFALLYMTFASARLALLIFLNIPLAATGGVAALGLRGYPFSISAGVGSIALFGIAVLNGVVLVSTVARLRQGGLSPDESARRGALTRLRPVVMTALVASPGFVPMALATSAGAEVQRPLAAVVIGGLATCTLLTLFVLSSLHAPWTRREPARAESLA